jgi:hypothetical protein
MNKWPLLVLMINTATPSYSVELKPYNVCLSHAAVFQSMIWAEAPYQVFEYYIDRNEVAFEMDGKNAKQAFSRLLQRLYYEVGEVQMRSLRGNELHLELLERRGKICKDLENLFTKYLQPF